MLKALRESFSVHPSQAPNSISNVGLRHAKSYQKRAISSSVRLANFAHGMLDVYRSRIPAGVVDQLRSHILPPTP